MIGTPLSLSLSPPSRYPPPVCGVRLLPTPLPEPLPDRTEHQATTYFFLLNLTQLRWEENIVVFLCMLVAI